MFSVAVIGISKPVKLRRTLPGALLLKGTNSTQVADLPGKTRQRTSLTLEEDHKNLLISKYTKTNIDALYGHVCYLFTCATFMDRFGTDVNTATAVLLPRLKTLHQDFGLGIPKAP